VTWCTFSVRSLYTSRTLSVRRQRIKLTLDLSFPEMHRAAALTQFVTR